MENCWFVLKQSHYPPPTLPANGIGKGNGAICLGHIVPSVKDVDGVVNRSEEGIEFTAGVPIYHTTAWDMEWEMTRRRDVGFSAEAKAPAAQVVGVSAQANAQLAFQRSIHNYRGFDKLDRYIIQPTRSWIAKVLEDAEVKAHIDSNKRLGAWSVFIITGVTIARGSHGGSSQSNTKSAGAGAEVDAGDVASTGFNATASSVRSMSMSAGAESDFVWAVRLTKISKRAIDKTWTYRVQSDGSTFSLDDEEQKRGQAAQELEDEGEGETDKIWLGDEGGFVVL